MDAVRYTFRGVNFAGGVYNRDHYPVKNSIQMEQERPYDATSSGIVMPVEFEGKSTTFLVDKVVKIVTLQEEIYEGKQDVWNKLQTSMKTAQVFCRNMAILSAIAEAVLYLGSYAAGWAVLATPPVMAVGAATFLAFLMLNKFFEKRQLAALNQFNAWQNPIDDYVQNRQAVNKKELGDQFPYLFANSDLKKYFHEQEMRIMFHEWKDKFNRLYLATPSYNAQQIDAFFELNPYDTKVWEFAGFYKHEDLPGKTSFNPLWSGAEEQAKQHESLKADYIKLCELAKKENFDEKARELNLKVVLETRMHRFYTGL